LQGTFVAIEIIRTPLIIVNYPIFETMFRKLSIESNPFTVKDRTLWSNQSM